MKKSDKWQYLTVNTACAVLTCLLGPLAHAQGLPSSVFTEALIAGEAIEPLPDDKTFGPLIKAIKSKTGNPGTVVVKAMRISKFVQQPTCGRIAFIMMQPATKTAWDDLGGQLNVCADGGPPLRTCKGHPGSLYPFNTKCPDGSEATDTPEVAEAIKKALSSGGLSYEQVQAKVHQNAPSQHLKKKEGAAK